ncbi:MAG: HipA domain-containing protein [Legionellaceae bacterium]|nr:HipA domain-containing protein [Legionellaceae bacterium]
MVTTKKAPQTLHVVMNGYLIGRLKKNTRGKLIFTYAASWLSTPGARPISLALPLVEQPFTTEAVYHFFDGLLPDNPEIRARIQKHWKLTSKHPFDLLACIGNECAGAVQLIAGKVPAFKKKFSFKTLDKKSLAERLRNQQDTHISLAGTQEKIGLLYHNHTWCMPQDKTPTSHLIKTPKDILHSAENEWLCAQIAKAFGLPVAESRLLYVEGIKALAVKRFDRKFSSDNSWLMRLPQEDLCQALGTSPFLKYQVAGGPGLHDVMKFLLGSANPIHDRDVFYCSQILFWLLANHDGHAKNFSVFIEPAGKYRLTPLYDIQSAYPAIAQDKLNAHKIKMAMPLKSKASPAYWHEIKRADFLETAKQINYSVERAKAILNDMLARVDVVIAQVSSNLPQSFPKQVSEPIFDGMRFMKSKLAAHAHPSHKQVTLS